jgi:tellurite resistance protein TerC
VSAGGKILNVSTWVWAGTLGALTAILLVDLLIIGRRPHEPDIRESTMWVVFYVVLALLFGGGVWMASGPGYAGQFYAGWLTEYSLSVDNLFVFVIIMGRFAVRREFQQKVLLIGILLALVMRGAFIAAGAALITKFVWVFYLFGVFLVYTAVNMARQGGTAEDDIPENLLIRLSRRLLPISRDFDGARMTTVGPHRRRIFTPMLIVMIAIGTTDLIFALDSIPAIFGLTEEAYLVFTANVFALMGLRQLYFLLGDLLNRLVYLSKGLAVVLGFIGVKLVLQALAENNVPFINGGEHVKWAPHIPIWLSLTVIVGTLAVATLASLAKTARDRRSQVGAGAGLSARSPANSSAEDESTEAGLAGAESTGAESTEAGLAQAGLAQAGLAQAMPAEAELAEPDDSDTDTDPGSVIPAKAAKRAAAKSPRYRAPGH